MWIAAALSRDQPSEPEHCGNPAAVDSSANDLPAHVCAGFQRKVLLAMADGAAAGGGAGRSRLFYRPAQICRSLFPSRFFASLYLSEPFSAMENSIGVGQPRAISRNIIC